MFDIFEKFPDFLRNFLNPIFFPSMRPGSKAVDWFRRMVIGPIKACGWSETTGVGVGGVKGK